MVAACYGTLIQLWSIAEDGKSREVGTLTLAKCHQVKLANVRPEPGVRCQLVLCRHVQFVGVSGTAVFHWQPARSVESGGACWRVALFDQKLAGLSTSRQQSCTKHKKPSLSETGFVCLPFQVQEVIPISSYDTGGSFLLLGCENGSIYYIGGCSREMWAAVFIHQFCVLVRWRVVL